MDQTAVEWLYKNLLDNPMSNEDVIYNINVLEKAKEMEKQQIIDAYEAAMETDIYNTPLKVGKQYYDETYNK